MAKLEQPGHYLEYQFSEILDYPDSYLLSQLDHLRKGIERYQQYAGRIEQEILRRMEERGARAIPDDFFVCEALSTMGYDQMAFTPLKEILVASELLKCLTPAHEETVLVPDKWNTAKVKSAAAKSGAEALAIVDKARRPGTRRLKFERKGA